MSAIIKTTIIKTTHAMTLAMAIGAVTIHPTLGEAGFGKRVQAVTAPVRAVGRWVRGTNEDKRLLDRHLPGLTKKPALYAAYRRYLLNTDLGTEEVIKVGAGIEKKRAERKYWSRLTLAIGAVTVGAVAAPILAFLPGGPELSGEGAAILSTAATTAGSTSTGMANIARTERARALWKTEADAMILALAETKDPALHEEAVSSAQLSHARDSYGRILEQLYPGLYWHSTSNPLFADKPEYALVTTLEEAGNSAREREAKYGPKSVIGRVMEPYGSLSTSVINPTTPKGPAAK